MDFHSTNNFFDHTSASELRLCKYTGFTKVKQTDYCGTHLVHGTEDVSIILLEATDTCETCQGSRQLIPVQDSKISHAKW